MSLQSVAVKLCVKRIKGKQRFALVSSLPVFSQHEVNDLAEVEPVKPVVVHRYRGFEIFNLTEHTNTKRRFFFFFFFFS